MAVLIIATRTELAVLHRRGRAQRCVLSSASYAVNPDADVYSWHLHSFILPKASTVSTAVRAALTRWKVSTIHALYPLLRGTGIHEPATLREFSHTSTRRQRPRFTTSTGTQLTSLVVARSPATGATTRHCGILRSELVPSPRCSPKWAMAT